MNINLTGKRALVCGSTQGIGKAAALELATLGASVTVMARNRAALEEVVDLLDASQGQQHEYLQADFGNVEEVKQAIANNNNFHILINNTGGPPGGQAIDAEIEEYIDAFSKHLLNNQILTRAVVPFMKSAGYGRIVNIISTSVKMPIKGLGVSNTIRGAVANWSKTLAGELGDFGITVNNVLPGATSTGRLAAIIENKASKTGKPIATIEEDLISEIPAGRFAEAGEVAAAIAFLATPAAAYINGINVPVDGGRTGSL
jgi:3-oxoacyl-[acyl-carrier protein] reductase